MQARTLFVSLFLAILLGDGPAVAQPGAASGSVRGVVTATGGEVAAGADVRLIGTTRRVSTGADGGFAFDGVRPGQYLIEVVSGRYGSAIEAVNVGPGQQVSRSITLELDVHREEVVVTASPDPRGAAELAQPVAELSGNDLLAAIRPTLGETVAALPGVNQTFFGAGASRPVIRGIGGDRIRVLEDGIGTGDASTTSPDHAVAFDPLSAAEVEVVRGPATLLYGSSAVGGVVNVLTESVPSALPGEPISGTLTLAAGTASDSRAGSLGLEGGTGHFAWHLDGFQREDDDYESGLGTVRNSFVETDGGSAGASYISNDGFIGASYGTFDSDYGNPGEPDAPVTLGMEQKRWNVRGEWLAGSEIVRSVKVRAGGADYEHTEFEGPEVGTLFLNDSEEARLELLHGAVGPLAGAIGVQANRREFSALGAEAFVPPTDTETTALFLFEEASAGAARYQFGLRYETSDLTAEPFPIVAELAGEAEPGAERIARDFAGVSGSFGVVWSPNEAWSLAGSLARSVKLPNAEELFSNGPHIATLAFEIGDPELEEETSLGVDVALRRRVGRVTGELSVFTTRFDDYIFEEFTGEFTEPEEGEEEEEPLRIVRFVQRDAEFTGAELLGHIQLMHEHPHHLEVEVSADVVRAELRDTGEPLPRIPARRFGVGLIYRGERLSGSIGVRRTDAQDRVSDFETRTDGYTAINASAGYRFFVGDTVHDVILTGTNLTDEEARNHVSFLKDIALLPGRDVRLSYRVGF